MGLKELVEKFERLIGIRPKQPAASGALASDTPAGDILLDEAKPTAGVADATAFFTAVCGRSMKEILGDFGATNIAQSDNGQTWRPTASAARRKRLEEFRKLGALVYSQAGVQIFARPGRYPVDMEGGRGMILDPTEEEASLRPHATVVFTVREVVNPGERKRMTIHFKGDGQIRAKGRIWHTARPDRPTHYDGAEVRKLIEEQARGWAKRIHWCSPREKP